VDSINFELSTNTGENKNNLGIKKQFNSVDEIELKAFIKNVTEPSHIECWMTNAIKHNYWNIALELAKMNIINIP